MTTTLNRPSSAASDDPVLTPRVRTVTRRAAFWVVAVLVLALLAVSTVLLSGSGPSTARLSATNAHPAGARALIQTLKRDGVSVAAPRTLTGALAAASRHPDATTLVLYDRQSLLSSGQLAKLAGTSSEIVLIEPSFRVLKALAPGVSAAGKSASTVRADCEFAPVRAAKTVSGLGKAYRVTSSAPSTTCLASHGAYSLVRVEASGQTATVLGSTTVLTNGSITRAGDAALALGVFGQQPNLVWYLPSLDEVPAQADGAIPAPPWVPMLAVLAGLVVVAAAVWRGRRLGPIVVERLPVIVRASETLEGRARLYEKASARLHALDALRIGSLGRLSTLCGLSSSASVEEIIGVVATETGRSASDLRSLLVDAVPDSDARLVRLSDDLAGLERDVAAATRPS